MTAAASEKIAEAALPDEVLDVDEVASVLKCTPRHVRDLARQNKLPGRIGGLGPRTIRFSKIAILDFINAGGK